MGVLGYLMRKYDFSPSAMVLAMILGFMVETSLRRSLIISYGDLSCFYTRPIALALIVLAADHPRLPHHQGDPGKY